MSAPRPSPRRRAAAGLLALTQAGHAQWFFGNLYEAVVKVPDLLGRRGEGSARGHQQPLSPLGPGSPLRYYAPAMPATTPAALAALALEWNDAESRPWLAAAVACSVFGSAAGVYLVRAINLDLFFSDRGLSAPERERLLRKWYRVNAARIAATGGVLFFAHQGRRRLLR